MTVADDARDHHTRCAPHLARLRMLAAGQPGAPLPPGVVRQVTEATSVILAEAKAAERAALTPVAGGPHAPGNPSLLAARLTRLENAARDAIASARDGNAAMLRQQLRRFDALTSAMWTVQLSACDPGRSQARARERLGLGLVTWTPLWKCHAANEMGGRT